MYVARLSESLYNCSAHPWRPACAVGVGCCVMSSRVPLTGDYINTDYCYVRPEQYVKYVFFPPSTLKHSIKDFEKKKTRILSRDRRCREFGGFCLMSELFMFFGVSYFLTELYATRTVYTLASTTATE